MIEFSISNQDWFYIFIISGIFISIFISSELIQFLFHPPIEVTRKFVHLSGGIITLTFSYLFTSHWAVLILCIGFVGILYSTKKLKLLNSVHGIERPSLGGLYFPLAVYITFIISSINQQPHLYLIGMLILSISDSMAALVGTSYGKFLFLIEKERKSVEGTLIFLLMTFLITEQGMLHLTDAGPLKATLCGIYVAILVTGFELLSLKGTDNLFIPIGTVYILIKYPRQSSDEMIFQLFLLIGILLAFIFIGKIKNKLGFSALAGIGLMAYGAWGLVEFPWFIPISTAFLLVNFGDFFIQSSNSEQRIFRIRTVFYLLGMTFLWILIVNIFLEYQSIFIVPYIFTILTVLNLSWHRQIKHKIIQGETLTSFQKIPEIFRLLILFVLFYPIQLLYYPDLNLLFVAISTIPFSFLFNYFTNIIFTKMSEALGRIDIMRYNLFMSILLSLMVLFLYWGLILFTTYEN